LFALVLFSTCGEEPSSSSSTTISWTRRTPSRLQWRNGLLWFFFPWWRVLLLLLLTRRH
jgi:hypothetical protein